ncbi:MAG: V-type ATPase 116kDa subunit family protein, partial [Planctomycetota bacterium]|jgi:V/A-type H+-transporting ATPase subunit I
MLVKNFGVPKYGTIDPTPFVMPLYLAMFGLMFGDVGQGLVLAIAGGLGVHFWKKNQAKEGLYNLAWLIIWCGCSSVLFGVLFGAYFGKDLFPPLWFDYHGIIAGHSTYTSAVNDIFDVLAITIYFGISVIFLGLIFNWINVIRQKKWDLRRRYLYCFLYDFARLQRTAPGSLAVLPGGPARTFALD